MTLTKYNEHILVINEFWSTKVCDEFILKSEKIGYEPAMVQTGNGQKIVESVRNNQRILFTDQKLADEIWGKVQGSIKPKLGKSVAIGLNEMFRFYKYEKNQKFKKTQRPKLYSERIRIEFLYVNDLPQR